MAHSTTFHGRRLAGGRPGVQVPDVPLRQMEDARGDVRRTGAVVRHVCRRRDGPHTAGGRDPIALLPRGRTSVFRRLRGPQTDAGAPRPRAGARGDGQGLRAFRRPERGRGIVQARQALRAFGEFARGPVEGDQSQTESDVHRVQTQIDVGRHKRMRREADRQLERTDDQQ